jgi:hypothetical protein
VAPTSVSFGDAGVNESGPAQKAQIANVGAIAVVISGIAVTGTNARDFTETNTQ